MIDVTLNNGVTMPSSPRPERVFGTHLAHRAGDRGPVPTV